MRGKRGRPAFKVTAARRESVKLMKADGFTHERIAAQLGCTTPTLLRHFAAELEFGADTVRRQALESLRRASRKGNVAASKALLNIASLEPPPAPSSTPLDVAPKAEEKLGKKDQANRDALVADEGTSWSKLVN